MLDRPPPRPVALRGPAADERRLFRHPGTPAGRARRPVRDGEGLGGRGGVTDHRGRRRARLLHQRRRRRHRRGRAGAGRLVARRDPSPARGGPPRRRARGARSGGRHVRHVRARRAHPRPAHGPATDGAAVASRWSGPASLGRTPTRRPDSRWGSAGIAWVAQHVGYGAYGITADGRVRWTADLDGLLA